MKRDTKVYAGGAVIARQQRTVSGGQNYDSIEWATADPVTGNVGKFSYAASGASLFTEEVEPLGQKISSSDPTDALNPSYQTYLGSAGDAEWQCQAGKEFYGGFTGMPFHCQMKMLLAADNRLP